MSEKAILYEIVINNNDTILRQLDADLFNNQYCGMIFTLCKNILANNDPVNYDTIIGAINKSNEKDMVKQGLCSALNNLKDDFLMFDNTMVKELKENYMIRNIKHYLTDTLKKLGNNYRSFDALSDLEKLVDGLSCYRDIIEPTQYDDYRREYVERIRKGELDKHSLIPVHNKSIAKVFDGNIWEGQLIIVGARPGMGKTLLTDNLCIDIGRQCGIAYFSLENTKELVCRKLIAMDCRINTYRTRLGDLEQWEIKKIEDTIKRKDIFVYDNHMNIDQIRLQVEQLSKVSTIKAVVIDYFQLLPYVNHVAGKEYEQFKYACRQIQEIKKMGITVFLLSQSNDRHESKTDETLKFRLGDLKGCGSLEADADIVIGIEGVRSDEKRTLNKLKDRNGGLNLYEIEFDFKTGRIKDND